MPKENKANKAEKEARTNKIFEMLVGGMARYQILQYVSDKTDWNLTARQVDNYIKSANGMIAAEAEFHRAREVGRAVTRLNNIYTACMKVQDFGRAISAQRELNQLLALYEPPAPQTLQLHHKVTTLSDMSDEDLRKVLDVTD